MPILAQVVAAYWTDLVRIFGLWAMLPAVAVSVLTWVTIRKLQSQRTEIKALEADKAQKAAEIRSLHEARLSDATAMLREMLRVTRETETARAERRELDMRFFPIQESMLQLLEAHHRQTRESP